MGDANEADESVKSEAVGGVYAEDQQDEQTIPTEPDPGLYEQQTKDGDQTATGSKDDPGESKEPPSKAGGQTAKGSKAQDSLHYGIESTHMTAPYSAPSYGTSMMGSKDRQSFPSTATGSTTLPSEKRAKTMGTLHNEPKYKSETITEENETAYEGKMSQAQSQGQESSTGQTRSTFDSIHPPSDYGQQHEAQQHDYPGDQQNQQQMDQHNPYQEDLNAGNYG